MRLVSLIVLPLIIVACNGDDTDDTGSDTDGTGVEGTSATGDDLAFYSYSTTGCANADTVLRGEADTEDGHWSAARITPSQDMSLEQVRIHLFHDPLDTLLDCEATLPTSVNVYVTSDSEPPADSEPDLVLSVPTAEVNETERVITLPAQLELNAGDNVFVAIQVISTSTSATCLRTCPESGGSWNFWSNADARPYSWSAFSDIGLADTTQFFSIHGTAN